MSYLFHAAFWLFVLVLAFSFFGISIQAIINSPAGQANVSYVLHLLQLGWLWLQSYVQHLI